MALYRLSVSTLSRRDNRNAVAAAAYRAGERIEDERQSKAHDYRAKRGVEQTALVGWRGTRAELWNRAEAAERRKDAQVAREVQLALPRELNEAQRWALTLEAARYLSAEYGTAVDVAMHKPTGRDRQPQPHAHLLMPTRQVDEAGNFGAKLAELANPVKASAHVERWRETWAAMTNRALAAAQVDAQVEHRSYARRGVKRDPVNTPRAAVAMEQRGQRTERGAAARRAGRKNELRGAEASARAPIPTPKAHPEIEARAVAAYVEQRDREATYQRYLSRREQEGAKLAAKLAAQVREQPRADEAETLPAHVVTQLPQVPAKGKRR